MKKFLMLIVIVIFEIAFFNAAVAEIIPVSSTRQQQPVTTQPNILIFVSFSLPKESIVAYLREAKKIHAGVVIRGLVDNSFQKTFKKMAELVKEAGGGGVELNPLWFEKFHIESVPTVVVVPINSHCLNFSSCSADSDFDAISGNISLQGALAQIKDHGQIAQAMAKRALDQLARGEA